MTMAQPESTACPPRLSHAALFLKFLRFGALAFGGPVAQIAMLRQALVDEEQWISSARFNRLLAVMQALPGPEAHELCVHFGIMARGRVGGLLAGLGFMLPGLVLMLLAAWGYSVWVAGRPGLAGLLLGVQLAVVAIVARAVVRIGGHILEDRLLWALAGIAAVATLIGTPFWIPLIAGGVIYAIGRRPAIAAVAAAVAILLAILLHPEHPHAAVAATREPATLTGLFVAGLKGGLLTFGGAYTAIPFVRADTVGRGWLGDPQFLDGVAVAGVLPAPLVIFATFAGFVAGGLPGALAITAGMFLPAFGFSMLFFERLEALVEAPALHRLLAGVAAAVVGVIAATCLQIAFATAARVSTPLAGIAIVAVALVVVWRWKSALAIPAIVAGAGLAGWAAFPA